MRIIPGTENINGLKVANHTTNSFIRRAGESDDISFYIPEETNLFMIDSITTPQQVNSWAGKLNL
ncbi:MAG: hypothetical protein KatS3mg131_2338 [Candidatus Tectimicrobiota bacterium]|nr:MAG: hypothetical protein KatS3mg131_2338 [Candidatus Tectomicrobia bacterium]